jgi:hypothetical protein
MAPETTMVAVPRKISAMLQDAHRDHRRLLYKGETWIIEKFSVEDPPELMVLRRAKLDPASKPIDLDTSV